ncbi:MAG: UDP-N-acetylmuramoyl-L-alanyl-D-glutamate--2,6-diaminopimelate ligase [Pseudomonadota bacterium]
MTVTQLFAGFPEVRIVGDPNVEVDGIAIDSRNVTPGVLFVALPGAKTDGNRFISEAIRRGASAIAAEHPTVPAGTTAIHIPNSRRWLGEIASRLYGDPSLKMRVVGITGTNGKTTTAHLIEAILRSAGANPAFVGTVGYRWNGVTRDAPHTTPEASDLHAMFRTMLDEGVTEVVMECSSHGLEQGRLGGVALDVALFTNLTQDHLDFHGTMEAYREAKWKLFSELLDRSPKEKRLAVLNLDDPVGSEFRQRLRLPTVTFSVDSSSRADVHPIESALTADGIRARIRIRSSEISIRSPLVGTFNLSNILAALAASDALGVPASTAAATVDRFRSVPGRLERIPNGRGVHVFVDYAHTDDALRNVIRGLAPLRQGRLIVVFGCGGDRDRGKRPKMARAAVEGAEVAIVTSDNPRSEKPEEIIEEIVRGFPSGTAIVKPEELHSSSRGVACSMSERRAAIEHALSVATRGDVVLIAGKGHETYQEIAGVRHPFDDRIVAGEWFRRNG